MKKLFLMLVLIAMCGFSAHLESMGRRKGQPRSSLKMRRQIQKKESRQVGRQPIVSSVLVSEELDRYITKEEKEQLEVLKNESEDLYNAALEELAPRIEKRFKRAALLATVRSRLKRRGPREEYPGVSRTGELSIRSGLTSNSLWRRGGTISIKQPERRRGLQLIPTPTSPTPTSPTPTSEPVVSPITTAMPVSISGPTSVSGTTAMPTVNPIPVSPVSTPFPTPPAATLPMPEPVPEPVPGPTSEPVPGSAPTPTPKPEPVPEPVPAPVPVPTSAPKTFADLKTFWNLKSSKAKVSTPAMSLFETAKSFFSGDPVSLLKQQSVVVFDTYYIHFVNSIPSDKLSEKTQIEAIYAEYKNFREVSEKLFEANNDFVQYREQTVQGIELFYSLIKPMSSVSENASFLKEIAEIVKYIKKLKRSKAEEEEETLHFGPSTPEMPT